MDIAKYQELTGITVPEANIALVTAQIRRTQSLLEGMLGYTLQKSKVNTNYYEEAGKTTDTDCGCGEVDGELSDPDEVVTAYRLFKHNKKDSYFPIDPFTKVNAVKLVYIRMGDEPNGVTLRTFESDNLRVVYKNGYGKYVQNCPDCLCDCDCSSCVQLAVDADWLYDDCLPSELEYLWADMVTFYSDPKNGIKSETLGPHSYTKFDGTPVESISSNLTIIRKYAGPNGSVYQTITV